MLKIGIVGLPNVGKSTLFQVLTKKQVDISNYPFTTIDPNVGVVAVPDERLGVLSRLSSSAKTVPAAVEFVDIAGLVKGAAQGEGLGNQFLSHIREVDAIAHIVRVFQDKNIVHTQGETDPLRDIDIINLELILADLQAVEKIIDKAAKEAKTGTEKTKKRLVVLEKIKTGLSESKLASQINLAAEEKELIKDVNLITDKPVIIVLNVDEKNFTDAKTVKELADSVSQQTRLDKSHIIAVPILLEQELASLNEQEQVAYKKEIGLKDSQSGINQLIAAGYAILDLITFFTTGEDETRAWTIKRGSTAPEAGAKIHSDFHDKFIRAEVIPYSEFIKIGSWSKARELGLLKTVGKDYTVQDGDIIEFRI